MSTICSATINGKEVTARPTYSSLGIHERPCLAINLPGGGVVYLTAEYQTFTDGADAMLRAHDLLTAIGFKPAAASPGRAPMTTQQEEAK